MADVLGILIHLGKGVDIVPKVSDDDLIYIASHIGRDCYPQVSNNKC